MLLIKKIIIKIIKYYININNFKYYFFNLSYLIKYYILLK